MSDKVSVQLLFFASAKDIAGVSTKDFHLSSLTSSANIFEEVSELFPGLRKLKGSIIISVNQQYYDCDQAVKLLSGDEIAFIPPISGEVTQLVNDASCGAISLFMGTTRDNFEGKKVHRLEYEAYDAMAEKEIYKICDECRKKWNVKKIAIYHRLGVVDVKEASIAIAVSSEHRRESLEAVSFLIDTLKASVPIWKKEIYDNDESEWKQNKECSWIKNEQQQLDDVEIKEEPLSDEDSEVTEMKVFSHPTCLKRKYKNNRYSCKKGKRDSTFVQIIASKDEIERRIKAFGDRKREELNILNIQQFCLNGLGGTGCARTAAVLLRAHDSSSHVKVTKVNNEWGPQTSIINKETSCEPATRAAIQSDGVEERIRNLEHHLHMSEDEGSSASIYARITALEKRVLFLEGLSPEYFSLKLQNQRVLTADNEEREEDIKSEMQKGFQSSDSDDEDIENRLHDNITIEEIDQLILELQRGVKKKHPNTFF